MAFSFAEGLAGFAKGAADYTVDSIRDQQKAEQEIKKMKLLEELRVATEERMSTFRENLLRNRADKDLSGLEGDEFVMRDAEGKEKSRRAATADEKEARQRARDKDDLSKRQGEASIRQSEASIRQGDERNALSRRGQDLDFQAAMARNAASGRGGGGDITDQGLQGTSSSAIGYKLTGMNKSIVDNAVKGGIPAERVQQLASIVVSRALARGEKNLDVINSDFLDGLTELRRGVDGAGENASWSLDTYRTNSAKRNK